MLWFSILCFFCLIIFIACFNKSSLNIEHISSHNTRAVFPIKRMNVDSAFKIFIVSVCLSIFDNKLNGPSPHFCNKKYLAMKEKSRRSNCKIVLTPRFVKLNENDLNGLPKDSEKVVRLKTHSLSLWDSQAKQKKVSSIKKIRRVVEGVFHKFGHWLIDELFGIDDQKVFKRQLEIWEIFVYLENQTRCSLCSLTYRLSLGLWNLNQTHRLFQRNFSSFKKIFFCLWITNFSLVFSQSLLFMKGFFSTLCCADTGFSQIRI